MIEAAAGSSEMCILALVKPLLLCFSSSVENEDRSHLPPVMISRVDSLHEPIRAVLESYILRTDEKLSR